MHSFIVNEMKDGIVELRKNLDAFFDGEYVSPEVCDTFYKTTRGFFNDNPEEHIGIGIYPSGSNKLTFHFLKYNAKNDKIKIVSRRSLVICPMTECLLKNAMKLAKLKRSDDEKGNDYIQ